MTKKFEIILADPPWLYNARNNPNTKFGTGAHKYPLLTTTELCKLPVNKVTADNAALILWVTFPRLKDGLKVLDAWGFDFKTVAFVWVKTDPKMNKLAKAFDMLYTRFKLSNNSFAHWLAEIFEVAMFFGIGYYTKCLDGKARVYIRDELTDRIFLVSLKELYEKDLWKDHKINTINGWKKIKDMVKNDGSSTYRVKTPVTSFNATKNHKLLTKFGASKRIDFYKEGNKRKFYAKVEYMSVEKIKQKKDRVIEKTKIATSLLFDTEGVSVKNPIETVCFGDTSIVLTNELAWLIGLFVAEGNYGSGSSENQIKFTLHEKEIEYYERIKSYVESLNLTGDRYFNKKLEAYKHKIKNSKAMSVYFSKECLKEVTKMFINGTGSKGKTLNLSALLSTSKEFRMAFIQGILDGDGFLEKGKYQRITLCNKRLIYDIKDLMLSVGMPSSVIEDIPTTYTYKGKKMSSISHRLSVYFRGTNIEYDKSYLKTVQIDNVESSDNLTTYDLCVEGSTFNFDGIVSHNSNAEIALLGVKGKMKPDSNSVSQIIIYPRMRHSAKPPTAYDKIVRLFGKGKNMLELFARNTEEGWTALGNELDGRDIRDSINDFDWSDIDE